MKKKIFLCVIILLSFSPMAMAIQIPFDSVTGTGTYYHNLALLTDNYIPPEGTQWQTNTVYWYGTVPQFTFDTGGLYAVGDIILSVDNNDHYRVDYSTNNTDWSMLFTIDSSYGDVGWGMDTMGTVSGIGEYVWQIDFNPIGARYLRIYATGGDNSYSIGEFQAFGNPVPEPATMLLLGSGLVGLAGFRRNLRKK